MKVLQLLLAVKVLQVLLPLIGGEILEIVTAVLDDHLLMMASTSTWIGLLSVRRWTMSKACLTIRTCRSDRSVEKARWTGCIMDQTV